MGVTRARTVKRRKKKEIEKTLRMIVVPPVVVGMVVFGKKGYKKKWK